MPAELDSNADEVDAWLASLIASYDFTRPGAEGSLGRDLAVAVAEGIRDRSVPDALGPDKEAWDANEPKYAKYKREKYAADQPNVRTGQMLSHASLLGEVVIEPESVELRYGTGTPPQAAFNGATLSVSDESISDIEKAFFCSKRRPFYAMHDDDTEACRKVAQESLDKAIGGA